MIVIITAITPSEKASRRAGVNLGCESAAMGSSSIHAPRKPPALTVERAIFGCHPVRDLLLSPRAAAHPPRVQTRALADPGKDRCHLDRRQTAGQPQRRDLLLYHQILPRQHRRRIIRRGHLPAPQPAPSTPSARTTAPTAAASSSTVDELSGRATKIQGDPAHPVTRGFLCGKVAKYLDRVYAPTACSTPCAAAPASPKARLPQHQRGSTPSSASPGTPPSPKPFASRLTRISKEHGPESILPYSYAGTIGQLGFGSMDRRFFHRLGASQLDRTICASAGGAALMAVYGTRLGTRPEDFAHAGLILAWGANIHGNNIHLWPFIEQARRSGARLVVIDPFRTRTAALADEHLAIRPGTDVLLALGLMHVIFSRQPRRRRLPRPLHHRRRRTPRPRPPARARPDRVAAEITGLPADRIIALAHAYAPRQAGPSADPVRPAVIRLNYGIQRSENGGTATRAVAMLPLVTGCLAAPRWRPAALHLRRLPLQRGRPPPPRPHASEPARPPGPHRQHEPARPRAHAARRRRPAARPSTPSSSTTPTPPPSPPTRTTSCAASPATTSSPSSTSSSSPTPPTTPTSSSPRPPSSKLKDVQGAYGHLFAGINQPSHRPARRSPREHPPLRRPRPPHALLRTLLRRHRRRPHRPGPHHRSSLPSPASPATASSARHHIELALPRNDRGESRSPSAPPTGSATPTIAPTSSPSPPSPPPPSPRAQPNTPRPATWPPPA